MKLAERAFGLAGARRDDRNLNVDDVITHELLLLPATIVDIGRCLAAGLLLWQSIAQVLQCHIRFILTRRSISSSLTLLRRPCILHLLFVPLERRACPAV